MKTTKIFFKSTIIFLIAWNTPLYAQDIERTVIANAGGYYQNLIFGNLHWTLGEVAVSRLQNGMELGEGFHRSYFDLLVETTDVTPFDWEVIIFPNPTLDQLQVKIPDGEIAALQLYSSAGQLLLIKEEVQYKTVLDLSHLPAATYWLSLITKNGQQRNFQLQKIQY